MRAKFILLTWIAMLLAGAGPSGAQTTDAVVDIIAAAPSAAQLTLNPSTITFPDADPSTVPSIQASFPVQVTANVTTGNNKTVTLTALAQGDLVSGSNTIPIGKVTWTASGTGFVGGTLSKTTAQSVGRWRGSSPLGGYTGALVFYLQNSWSYATGHYTQNVTFTLYAP